MKSQLTLLAFLWLSIAFSQDAFITTWKTDNPGVSGDNQITIPTFPGETYNYSVDWGDGTNDFNITTDITHTYATAGTYAVSITGIFPRIYFNERGDKDKLLNITQWGNIAWSSMESAFAGCNYLSVAANDSPDLSNVTSLRRMFYYCNYSFDMTWSREFKNFNGVENFNNWDVSTITDMANMFDKSTFGQEISSWDVSNVTDMSYLFHSTQFFNHDISKWDVGNVVSMEATFGSSSFNSDITSWNVSSVTNMNAMFNGAPFDQDITQWDVSNVMYMSSMFNRTKFDKDLSSWDVGNVITFYNIFDYSDLSRENYDKILIGWSQLPSLQYGVELGAIQVQYCLGDEARNELINNYNWTIIDQGQYCEEESPFITTWKTDNPGASSNNQITIPTNPFENYEYTVDWGDGTKDTGVTGDITHTYDSPGTYQVSILGRFPYIFFNNPDAQYPVGTPRKDSDKEKIISIDQWGTNRWSDMSFSFAGCKNLDILATDTPNFSRNKALIYTFYECSSLVGSESFVQWDLGESVYIDGMFSGASSFNQPIGSWDMSNFKYFRDVFKGTSSFNQNLKHWNFENVQTMEGMFDGSGMSVDNYDKLLTTLLESSTINKNIILGAENLNYCIGETARQSLIDIYGWVINDAGKDCSETYFITTWKTDNPGVSNDNQVKIPTYPGEIYDYIVDWGDGTNDNNVTGDITHTYASAGTYQVSISGVFPRIYFNYSEEGEKIISIDQWGNIEWSSMEWAFAGCSQIEVNANDIPDFSGLTSIATMFVDCTQMIGNPSFNNWDLSTVTSISNMFRGANNFNVDIGNWNTSNITTMNSLFQYAHAFNQDLSKWDTSKVQSMSAMFSNAKSFNTEIGNWNVKNVTDMSQMFHGAEKFNGAIGNWDVSNVNKMDAMFGGSGFNHDIGNWDVGNVNNMNVMFSGSPFNQDIDGWDVSSVTDMGGMFSDNEFFNQNLDNWNTSQVLNMMSMFSEAQAFNQSLASWDVSSVTNMSGMFDSCSLSIQNYDSTLEGWSKLILKNDVYFDAGNSQYCSSSVARKTIIENFGWTIEDAGANNQCRFITTWKTDNPGVSNDNQVKIPTYFGNTSFGEKYSFTVDWGDGNIDYNVNEDITHTYIEPGIYTIKIDGLFPRIFFNGYAENVSDAKKIISVDNWGSIIWSSMERAFLNCSKLDIKANDNPILENVSSFQSTFEGCTSLIGNESIGEWQVESGKIFARMFYGAIAFNQNLNNWNVSNAVNMSELFANTNEFNGDISDWNLQSIEFMDEIFFNAASFDQPIGKWNVKNITNMFGFFAGAKEFNQDLSSWDVSNVKTMQAMFSGAKSFNQDLSSWNVSNVVNMNSMFAGAETFNQPLNSWDVSSVKDMNGMFSGAVSFNNPLDNWNVFSLISMDSMFNNALSFNQSLSEWNIANVSIMGFLFQNTSISLENYDSTLIGWANQTSLQYNLEVFSGNIQYCESEEARQFLINTYGWNITDGGKVLFCNEDNDFDGVLDHEDACLNTLPDVTVNENGCEIIPLDAILVYGLTATCPGESNGSIQVSSTLTDRSYNISLDGPMTITENNVSLSQPYIINNLSTGLYTVEISIPEASFTQSFGIQINEVGSISGKRANLDLKSKSVSYSVQGSHSYKVNINNKEILFNFDSAGPNQIQLNDLNGFNTISITGESDCQGSIEDSFSFMESVVMYPINTKNKVYVEGFEKQSEIQIFDISGRLLFQKKLSENQLETIDFQSYQAGVYPVKIISNQDIQTFKIIKE